MRRQAGSELGRRTVGDTVAARCWLGDNAWPMTEPGMRIQPPASCQGAARNGRRRSEHRDHPLAMSRGSPALACSVRISRDGNQGNEELKIWPASFVIFVAFCKNAMICGSAARWFTPFFRPPTSDLCRFPFAIFRPRSVVRGPWCLLCAVPMVRSSSDFSFLLSKFPFIRVNPGKSAHTNPRTLKKPCAAR